MRVEPDGQGGHGGIGQDADDTGVLVAHGDLSDSKARTRADKFPVGNLIVGADREAFAGDL